MAVSSESDRFTITSSRGDYEVVIEAGSFDRHMADRGGAEGGAPLICDARFAERFAPLAGDRLLPVEATEHNKTIETCAGLIAELRRMGVSRKDVATAVGGGIVQDLTTFTTSVYMRGIDWVYFPTTLLGMVDSCIGGKSAINVAGYKNLAGNFHPPKRIHIDPTFVASLAPDQRAGGLLEAAKICFARGDEALDAFLDAAARARTDPAALTAAIRTSLLSKKWFIEVDEFDRNERLLLNFGHTFGHALESAVDFRINHGVAVGVGMMAAFAFARSQGLIGPAGETRIARLRDYTTGLLLTVDGLEETLRDASAERFLAAFASDKKHLRDAYVMVLPDAEGRLSRPQFPRNAAIDAAIIAANDSVIREIFR